MKLWALSQLYEVKQNCVILNALTMKNKNK